MADESGLKFVCAERAEFDDSITIDDIRHASQLPNLEVLQCNQAVSDDTWRRINEHFCSARPDVEIRTYGHEAAARDLGFTRLLSNVRRFAADCLIRAESVESLAELRQLESLSLGILDLTDLDVLARISPTLTSLAIGATDSKRPNLSAIGRFRSLRRLYIEGHHKDIEVLSTLPDLEHLTLRSVTTADLQFLRPLSKLRSLDIKLGGTRRFMGIEGKQSIRYLELWQIHGLTNIDFVSDLPGLQNLFLQSLARIASFPGCSELRTLRRIRIQSLKGLRDLSALEHAPALEEFDLTDGMKQTPEQLLPVLRNPRLKKVRALFGNERKNTEFVQLMRAHNKEAYRPSPDPFEYR